MFRRRCIAVFLFGMILLPVCRAQQASAQSETGPLVTGEALEIKVAGEPELSGTAVVQPDGNITLPLVNEVHAAGLTIQQLQARLEQKLKQFVKQPRVTVVAAGMAEQRRIRVAPDNLHPWLLPELWPVR